MIIHQPQIETDKAEVQVKSRIECQSSLITATTLPDTLWFSYPEAYKDCVTDRCDGFLASLLHIAMHFGEDIEVRGSVSPKLAYGLEEIQQIFITWFPKKFKHINIKYDQLAPTQPAIQKAAVGTAFSGGVDSLYSLWAHLPHNEPLEPFQLSHGLFILGFDLDTSDSPLNMYITRRYQELYERLDLKLILGKTNARQFYKYRIDWMYAHGGPLMGAALNLDGLFKRFYIPSTFYYNNLQPTGTSPASDHLYSTESLEFHHHGAGIQRFEKLDQLSEWTEAHSSLRVCASLDSQYQGPALNCGNCHKCLHSIVYLETTGQGKKYSVFAKGYSFSRLFRWLWVVFMSNEGIKRLAQSALKARRYEIAFMMVWMFFSVWLRKLLNNFRELLSYEQKMRILRMTESLSKRQKKTA